MASDEPNDPQHLHDEPLVSPFSDTDVTPLVTRPIIPSTSNSTNNIPMATSIHSSFSVSPIDPNRRPTATLTSRGSGLNVSPELQAKLKALHLGRQGAPPLSRLNNATSVSDSSVPLSTQSSPNNLRLPNSKPNFTNLHSAPAVPGVRMPLKSSLAEKRGMKLPGGLPGSSAAAAAGGITSPNTPLGGRKKPGLTLSSMNGGNPAANETKPSGGTMLDKYSEFLDAKTGSLQFKGKAILNSQGVQFADNTSFSISLDEVDTLDELGKGNYGTVYKVRHARPKVRLPGMGLAGNKASHVASNGRRSSDSNSPVDLSSSLSGTSGAVMAMKEIRLELDDAKFAAIIMELDILHRCTSPYVIDFYGAFFQEGAVYICMEYMNGGSIDKLYGDGIPESVLQKIAYSTTMGLKSLKEDHNIIHRDVKPTNILMNTRGQIKICDFGVSGNLVASIAKTNIGCQSYMAPERISSGGMSMAGSTGGTYSVQSDIWSLGLTLIECALGRYPYPPETYTNIFSQLSAIVEGDPPDLPEEGYSETARNFVRGCLNKIPKLRPSYPMLLQHAWLAVLAKPTSIIEEEDDEDTANSSASTTPDSPALSPLLSNVVDAEVAEWVTNAMEKRRLGKLGKSEKPALHAAPLEGLPRPSSDSIGSPQ